MSVRRSTHRLSGRGASLHMAMVVVGPPACTRPSLTVVASPPSTHRPKYALPHPQPSASLPPHTALSLLCPIPNLPPLPLHTPPKVCSAPSPTPFPSALSAD